MIREVDLVSYLPEFMQEYKEPVAALAAENSEFVLVWKAADEILANQFQSTADEKGISKYEEMLGIFPSDTDTLEMRKARVHDRWINKLPYTVRTLEDRLTELLGGDHKFSLTSNFKDGYKLVVVVYAINNAPEEDIRYILDTVMPVNMVAEIVFESPHTGSTYFGAYLDTADILEIKQR